jgi:hypothetical protein
VLVPALKRRAIFGRSFGTKLLVVERLAVKSMILFKNLQVMTWTEKGKQKGTKITKLCFLGFLRLNQRMNRDRLTKARRSWNMSRIRGRDTTPEKAVRSLLHRMGYRFRLNVKIPIELGKQEEKRRRSFGLRAKTPSVFVSDRAVRLNGHGHNVLFDSDGVFIVAVSVQEFLESRLQIVDDFALRRQFGLENYVTIFIAHHGHRTLAKCIDVNAESVSQCWGVLVAHDCASLCFRILLMIDR